jgi:cyclic pyranopterin monophosphate synthase
MSEFTHIKENGQPGMVDVSKKEISLRTATAQSIVCLPNEIIAKFNNGEIIAPKGAVLQTAIIGGIMAAKKTGDLIPLCHPIGLEDCLIEIQLKDGELVINCTTRIAAKTGVEMEALVGATIAALTIYDMCKAMSHNIIIKETKLIKKTGGKKDFERA